jgi:transcriptional regulator with XRE-family HTH domain
MAKRDRNRLRVVRAEKRITQLDTAIRAGIGFTRYWKIENGYVVPTDEERADIAKALRVSVDTAFPPPEAVAS